MPSNDTRLNQLIDARITAGSNRVALGKASGGTEAKQKALAVDEKANRALAVTEPEMPANEPSAPTGLTVEPFSRALAISWDVPPRNQHIRETEVRLYENPNPSGDVAERHLTNDFNHISANLLVKEYEVWVRYIDRWDREGDWATSLGTPLPSVADRIEEGTQALGRDFADLLNNPELNNFDSPEKLADATLETLSRASNGEYGAAGEGIVNYRMMAAIDVVAARALFGSAIIERAMMAEASVGDLQFDRASGNRIKLLRGDIEEVSASSIVTSSLNAATITLANNGKLVAGQTSLDSTGVSIAPASVYLNPGSNSAYKVGVNGDWSFMHFFTNSDSPPARGMHLRADGIDGTARYGLLAFSATEGGSLSPSESARAYLYKMRGGGPLFRVDGSIDARDDLIVGNELSLSNARVLRPRWVTSDVGPGQTLTWDHTFGGNHIAYLEYFSAGWRQLTNAQPGWNIRASGSDILITNNNSATISVRGTAFNMGGFV